MSSLTSTGSGYGSARRYEATASISTRLGARPSLLDEDDSDEISKLAPRRLGRLAALKSSYRSEDDADDVGGSSLSGTSASTSAYSYKRSRYTSSRLTEDDDSTARDDPVSSMYSSTLRKYSSSGGRDESFDLSESRYGGSTRFRSRMTEDDEEPSNTATSRLLIGRQSSLTRNEPSETDYGGKRSYSLNRETATSGSATSSTSRYTSRYATTSDTSGKLDDSEMDIDSESSRVRRSRYDRDSSRDDESLSSTRFTSKRYSRESSAQSAGVTTTSDVLRELSTSGNNKDIGTSESHLFRSERRNSDREEIASSKIALFETDLNASKRSLTDANRPLDDKVRPQSVHFDCVASDINSPIWF